MHMIIATRADPPFPLSRLRERGELLELRAHDLRFHTEDAMTYLNQVMGFKLSERQVSELVVRTEGWVGGLQMAALAMRDRTDIPTFISCFRGQQPLCAGLSGRGGPGSPARDGAHLLVSDLDP